MMRAAPAHLRGEISSLKNTAEAMITRAKVRLARR
jgi:hypothetical protein